jgi:cytochrome c oxidase subunit 3
MSREGVVMTAEARQTLDGTLLVRHRLEEQYANLEQQHETAAFGMWVFLATEVMFFGVLFLGVGVYHYLYAAAFEAASEKLNWVIGGINTLVLLLSSLTAVLAVHFAKLGNRRGLMFCLAATAILGVAFLGFKGVEYYEDYVDKLIPGWSFDDSEWVRNSGLKAEEVPHVKLFLLFYWIMTSLHGLHVIIGIGAMLVMFVLARNGHFSPVYYSPVDVTALYWHFVDIVWLFLLPTLYLMGTHSR